ncbi:MAG: hypothetical protein AB7S26_03660 [Sandaracinaceae bacterium]
MTLDALTTMARRAPTPLDAPSGEAGSTPRPRRRAAFLVLVPIAMALALFSLLALS